MECPNDEETPHASPNFKSNEINEQDYPQFSQYIDQFISKTQNNTPTLNHNILISESSNSPDQAYAVKIIRSPDEEIREVGLKEYKLLKTVSHPNIIRMYEAY